MKERMKERMRKRRNRYTVGYIGAGNLVYGKKFGAKFPTLVGNAVETHYPLTRKEAERLIKLMPSADCAIFELVPVEVNR